MRAYLFLVLELYPVSVLHRWEDRSDRTGFGLHELRDRVTPDDPAGTPLNTLVTVLIEAETIVGVVFFDLSHNGGKLE